MIKPVLRHKLDSVTLVLVGHRPPSEITVDHLEVVRVGNVCIEDNAGERKGAVHPEHAKARVGTSIGQEIYK